MRVVYHRQVLRHLRSWLNAGSVVRRDCILILGSSSSGLKPSSNMASARPCIGVVQMTSTPDKDENFEQAKSLIEQAKSQGAQMVFLPECFDYVGTSTKMTAALAEPVDGQTMTQYRNLARDMDLWLSLGGFHEKIPNEESRIYNSHIIINSTGEICGHYNKTHMFDVDVKGGAVFQESKFTIPGPTIEPPVDTPVGKVGMGICYDLRFPELSSILRQQGADILTYPSAFTVPTGSAHWHCLLRSRAIETQCYVIAAAQVGKHHEKRESYGHALVVDPWGTVVAECQQKPDVCTVELDPQYLQNKRSLMPVLAHRRPDLYSAISPLASSSCDEMDTYQFADIKIKSGCVFYKSSLSYAFVNIKPVIPGHVLISPLRVANRLSDLIPAEVSDIFLVTQKVASIVEKHFGGTSVTVSVQDGPQSGQTVPHMHVHILPRKGGDFAKNDDIYTKLEEHDKDMSPSSLRSEEVMFKEAAELRQYFL